MLDRLLGPRALAVPRRQPPPSELGFAMEPVDIPDVRDDMPATLPAEQIGEPPKDAPTADGGGTPGYNGGLVPE